MHDRLHRRVRELQKELGVTIKVQHLPTKKPRPSEGQRWFRYRMSDGTQADIISGTRMGAAYEALMAKKSVTEKAG